MGTLIYLDQNILSDLRARKLEEINNDSLKQLKHVLLASTMQVIYSHITLAEINQISIEKYRFEHIELLEELKAKYIDPQSKKLSNKKPDQVWGDYIENSNSVNDFLSINSLTSTNDSFSRKLSGIPVEENFDELLQNYHDSLKNISRTVLDQLNSLKIDNFEEPMKSAIKLMQKELPKLFNDSLQSFNNRLSELDKQPLGPKSFREYDPIKRLNISNLHSSEVVFEIENVFKQENPGFQWRGHLVNSPESRISRAYTLMNWAGYYPDDFDKIKKNRDRFRASTNDMLHASMACAADFLISNDYAFCMKAMASFKYADVHTIVYSPVDFLQKYCKFEDTPNE